MSYPVGLRRVGGPLRRRVGACTGPRATAGSSLAAVALVIAPAGYAQDKDDDTSRYTPTPAVSYPANVQNFRDVTYAELSGFRPLTLDLYVPPPGGAAKPAVVFIHGGAWRHLTARDGGTFRDFPATLASVAARGYVIASVNYRLAGEAHFPGAVQDVEMAIQWLRTHATDYNIDTSRFVAWGSSAGGQIAALIGTACGVKALEPPLPQGAHAPAPSPCVQGVIDWYGAIDLDLSPKAPPRIAASIKAYLGCEPASCPPEWVKSSSPFPYIDRKDPPFLIQHGAADVTVSPDQSRKLYDALRAAGVPAELVLYPNVSHGFAKVPEGGPDEAVNQQALDKVIEFLAHRFPPGK
jgi:acetyl esterase/lipase